MGRTGSHRTRVFVAVAVVVGLVATNAACSDDGPSSDPVVTQDDLVAEGLSRLHAERGERPGIFDELGRQIVLRAVNLNSLAHYAQNNSALVPTEPLTGKVWEQIASEGFNAVRLLVSWSRLEPQRNQIDDDYVEQIRQAVRDAANRGLYTVIDMHQDAWGPFVGSPSGTVCADGREPSTGWDGAPEWATPSPTEFDSCRGVGGEAKPGSDLVVEAWHRFYSDAAGVQSRLVAVWQHLAEALADEPSVAGYDLLNEPGHGRGETAPSGLLADFAPLGVFYGRAIGAIRRGEAAAGIAPRPVLFEPSVLGNPVPPDFSDDPGIVYAPHVYGGSIVSLLTVDQHWDLVWGQAQRYQAGLWIGEYGWFGEPAEHPEYVERLGEFGVREDGGTAAGATPPLTPMVPTGSAWWQWTQACGDPHRITQPGLEAGTADSLHYRRLSCPAGEDLGVVPQWREVVTRSYPRAVPGWMSQLGSDAAGRTLDVRVGQGLVGGQLELWVPGEDRPSVRGTGIAAVEAERSGIGWRVTAEVCAVDYQVSVDTAGSRTPEAC